MTADEEREQIAKRARERRARRKAVADQRRIRNEARMMIKQRKRHAAHSIARLWGES